MKKRNLTEVLVTPEFLAAFCFKGSVHRAFECVEGVPQDAELVGTRFCEERGSIVLTFIHESLPPVCEGLPLPVAKVEFYTVAQ